ncbi:winged helix-turn-helix transcriptional regulator [Natronorarus salvus]|uniref:winged helix-turn-helix transcriptional regulator n=1 Tax=Natronorarus salvus TaxID=3117733 RepID=UPI002F26A740
MATTDQVGTAGTLKWKHDLAEEIPAGLNILSYKHVPEILLRLDTSPAYFSQLQRELGASSKVLSDQLTRLVEAGVISRAEMSENNGPGRCPVYYGLTRAGKDVIPILGLIGEWSAGHDLTFDGQ